MERESGPTGKNRRTGESSGGEQTVSVGSNCGIIELGALDCTICYHPLRPQAAGLAVHTGHVVCSSCHDKLRNKDKCHVCSITGGYHRCIALEKILESVQVPCCNTEYGCTVKTHYLERAGHEKSCPCAPCFCPEDGCDFAGSTALLLRHLTNKHHCPSTKFEYQRTSRLELDQEGMHVLHSKEVGLLFLVKFTPVPPFGTAASIFCVHPQAVVGERKFRCHVSFSDNYGWDLYLNFLTISTTNLSNGLPTEDGSYSAVVPDDGKTSGTCIGVSISKIS